MTIDDVLRTCDGFLGEAEARLLNKLAANVAPPCVIVEIGAYRGRSTCALAVDARAPVYSVDTHQKDAEGDYPYSDEDRAAWMHNVLSMRCAARVRPISLPSADVAIVFHDPIGLLFIDACHSIKCVREDLSGWLPWVAFDGLVAMHDNHAPGVIHAVSERSDLQLIMTADATNVYSIKGK